MFVVLHNRYGNTIDSNTTGCINYETKSKRNERNETKRNLTKRNEIYYKAKRNATQRNEIYYNAKRNEMNTTKRKEIY
jgi:hypothetical protein